MKIRTLIAATMSVALLTVFITAPVSAGGPASFKVGARGVGYGIQAIATNCPKLSTAQLKQMGATGKFTGQLAPETPCYLPDGAASRVAAPRNAVDAALRTKTAARAETKPATPWGQDYYVIEAFTVGNSFGQAGSGYDFTGLGVPPTPENPNCADPDVSCPVTGLLYIAWIYDEDADIYDLYEGITYEQADLLAVAEDLAYGAASTWIPGLGYLDVECIAVGAWGRGAETLTGGIDPNDGWTQEFSHRTRSCVLGVEIAGTPLPFNSGLLQRTVFVTNDVYPYPS